MNTRNLASTVIVTIALVFILADYAQADKLQLEDKLSKDISIKLADVTISQALEKIGQKASLKIVLSDEAIWKLPQGKATRLSVELDGPLAESMTEMLNAFFMRYAVGDEEITIYPRPELEHILGRPTKRQLEVLRSIYTNPIYECLSNPMDTISKPLGGNAPIVGPDALEEIDYVLHKLCGIEPDELRSSDNRFTLQRPVTFANVLDQVALRIYEGSRWYLCGMDFPNQAPEIRFVLEEELREDILDQIVDISFKDEPASVVLQRLASWTGMELLVFKSETSWLTEKISVDMQNTMLKQALINITTLLDGGCEIDVEDNSIRIKGPIHRTTRAPQPRARSPQSKPQENDKETDSGYVGKISIPMDGGKYYIEFMLRESDLTEQLKKLREEKIKEILGRQPEPVTKRIMPKAQHDIDMRDAVAP